MPSSSEVKRSKHKEAAGSVLKTLTLPHFMKKFATFYETRRFITAFTTARHQSLSSDRSVQYTHSLRISLIYSIYFNIIPSTTPGSSKWSLFLTFRQPDPLPFHFPDPPQATSNPFFLIGSPGQYLVGSADHAAPLYGNSSALLFLLPLRN